MIEADEAAAPRKSRSGAARGLLGGLAGLGVGLGAGAAGGGLFALVYHPHGGGQVGDWTSLIAWVLMAFFGGLLGLVGGVLFGIFQLPLWKLFAGLGALSLLVSVFLMLSA